MFRSPVHRTDVEWRLTGAEEGGHGAATFDGNRVCAGKGENILETGAMRWGKSYSNVNALNTTGLYT